VSALLVVGVAGFWVFRRFPRLPALPPVEDQLTVDRIHEQRILAAAQWFIAMRWLAILGVGIMIFLGVYVYALLPPEVALPLTLTAALLVGLNMLYTLMIGRVAAFRQLLLVQACMDLVVIAVLLHYSGGVENPFVIVMIFHVLIGGVLLSRGECFALAATATALQIVLGLGEAMQWLPHHTLALFPHFDIEDMHAAHRSGYVVPVICLHTAVLFLTAYFVTNLSGNLRRNEGRLAEIAEQALGERRLLVQALETTSTGLRLLGTDLLPFWINQRWQDWFGDHRNECRIMPGLECDEFCPAKTCLEDGAMRLDELKVGVGKHRIFRITTAPLRDSQGRINRLVQLAQDVTDEKEAHEQMMHAGRMAAVGELAGQVAHEVNNPIGIISAKANLLLGNRREEMSEKVAGDLTKIRDLSDRIGRIAQGLLSYCRPPGGSRSRQDLRTPARACLAFVREQGRKHGIEFIDDLGEVPLYATINSAELEQVFLNLYLNAMQAMPDGGRVKVSLLAAGRDPKDRGVGWAGIAVDDSGPGVEPGLRERIFQLFFTTKTEGHGTGLGLPICQGLVKSHGGRIEVVDSPAGGARFLVWLPLKAPGHPDSSKQL